MIFFKGMLLMVGLLLVVGPVFALVGRLADFITHWLPLNDKWQEKYSNLLAFLLMLWPILYLAEYALEWAIVQDIIAWLYR